MRGFLLGKQESELTFFSSVGKHVTVVDCRSGPTVSQGSDLICMNSDAVVAEKAQKINWRVTWNNRYHFVLADVWLVLNSLI